MQFKGRKKLIKESVYAGHVIDVLQKEEKLSGIDIADDLHISPQFVSNLKNDHRKLHKDIAQASLSIYDNPIYTMELLYEFTEGLTSPIMRGRAVDPHRLAIEEYTLKEIDEIKNILNEVSLAKPPNETSNEEKERIKQIIYELLDGEMVISNLIAVLCKEYEISYKKCIQERRANWKAKGWI